MSNKVVGIAIGVLVAIPLFGSIATNINNATAEAVYDCGADLICGGANSADDILISGAGALHGTTAGSLVSLLPIILIAGLLALAYFRKS